MKVALGIPGVGEVPAAFAHDLARLVGYLLTARPEVDLQLYASLEEPSLAQRELILTEARAWGADLVVFPDVMTRIPANALDDVIEKAVLRPPAPKLEVVTH